MAVRGVVLSILAALCVIQPFGRVEAAPAPYSDWAFDVTRADEAQNMTAFGDLVKKKPDFARVWFYGRVFDLATPGIPEAEKVRLKSRLDVIAKILAQPPISDGLPNLLLDRAQTKTLKPMADESRALQERWMAQFSQMNALPVRLGVVQEPTLARIAFYVFIYRSELAVRRLGGPRDRRQLLGAARTLAEGFALADGDLGPWKALGAFYGTNGLPADVKGVVEQQVTAAVNAYVQGKPNQAKAKFSLALTTARAARGGSLMVALIMNGAAHCSVWLKEFDAAKVLRQQVLQGIRPLQLPKLTTLIVQQMITAYLKENNLREITPFTRELREAGATTAQDPRAIKVMLSAAQALQADAEAKWTEGNLEASLGSAREAKLIWDMLSDPKIIGLNHVTQKVDAVRVERVTRKADLVRLEGHIARRRGDYEEARAMYQQAIGLFDGLGNLPSAAGVEIDLANAHLASGDPQRTLVRTSATQKRLGGDGNPALRAQNYLIQGRARLTQGQYAKAYGNANYALKILRDAQVFEAHKSLRADLHLLAATVLDASGRPMDASERLRTALALNPADHRIVRTAVVSYLEQGDIDSALKALKPLSTGMHSQRGIIYQGCVLVSSSRFAEGVEMLSVIVPQLTLPNMVFENILGRTCLAMGQLKAGQIDLAAQSIEHARAKIQAYPHPQLLWRIHAIDGSIHYQRKNWLQAAGAFRQAMNAFVVVLGEQSWRGILIDQRIPALPRQPTSLLSQLPGAIAKGVASDQANQTQHIEAVINATRWLQQWPSSASSRLYVVDRPRQEAEVSLWSAFARMDALQDRISDYAVTRSERLKLAQNYRSVVGELKAKEEAVRALYAAEYDYFSPTVRTMALDTKEALIRYFVGGENSYLWLVIPGVMSLQYELPGHGALAQLLESARLAVNTPPKRWDTQSRRPKDPNSAAWKSLQKPTKVLLPFLKNKKVMSELKNRRIRVIADGPIMRFPLSALVTKLPKRRAVGQGPQFVGQLLDLQYGILDQSPGVSAEKKTTKLFVGQLSSGGVNCPTASNTSPCEPGLTSARLTAFQNGVGRKGQNRLQGTSVSEQELLGAIATHGQIIYFPPIDAMSGSLITSPAQSGQPYGRLESDTLAMVSSQAKEIMFAQVVAGPLAAENGRGIRRLHGALRAAGLDTIIMVDGTPSEDDSVWFEYLGRIARDSDSLSTAIRKLQTFAMTAKVDLTQKDHQVLHHPYNWARWLVFNAHTQEIKANEFTPPMDVFQPKADAPESPYGDDSSDTAAPPAPAQPPIDPQSQVKPNANQPDTNGSSSTPGNAKNDMSSGKETNTDAAAESPKNADGTKKNAEDKAEPATSVKKPLATSTDSDESKGDEQSPDAAQDSGEK